MYFAKFEKTKHFTFLLNSVSFNSSSRVLEIQLKRKEFSKNVKCFALANFAKKLWPVNRIINRPRV